MSRKAHFHDFHDILRQTWVSSLKSVYSPVSRIKLTADRLADTLQFPEIGPNFLIKFDWTLSQKVEDNF